MPIPTHIPTTELIARLALWRTKNVGIRIFNQLLKKYASIHYALQNESFKDIDWEKAEQDLRWLEEPHHHILIKGEAHYPQALIEIGAAPPLLFVKGALNHVHQPQIALVGSRNPSHYGRKVAQQFTTQIAEQGFIITSGLAIGIDSLCHQTALHLKAPTIAVLAVGLDEVYPKRHYALAENILAHGGALVSEFGTDTPVLAENFPRRNRIISGLSLGTVVIEASIKSGSLITARYAVEQGRDVFAVPGSIYQNLAQGCHALLKEGAYCVENGLEVTQHYAHLKNIREIKNTQLNFGFGTSTELTSHEKQLLSILNEIPQTLDDLYDQLDWSIGLLQSTLTQCCFKAFVQHTWLGYVRLS